MNPNPWSSSSGIPLKEFYDKGLNAELPGAFPFTRGIHPQMYRKRLWTMRQYSGFGDAKAANKRFQALLKEGQTGLSVAFDLPTQIGYDPDHRLARGEVGRVGVSIATLRDMEELLAGVPLDKISLSMTINATAIVLLAMLLAAAQKRKIPFRNLAGTVQNDILKEYIARGTFIYPPDPSLRLCADVIEYCTKNVPRFHPMSVSGYHIREVGATAVQEIAITMANAIQYVQTMRQRGMAFDAFGASLSFFFNVHNDFFEEIAKFRAARKIWARLCKERFKARDPEAMKLRFHVQTAGSSLTYQRAKNNLTRVTYQALAAVLGGAQSLHTNAWDEALGLPSEESAVTALRIQQIIAQESGVPAVTDPLGGSYFVESLTKELEDRAWALLQKIEAMGGALQAIALGFVQGQIHGSAYRAQRDLEEKRRLVVGVNIFPKAGEKIPRGFAPDARDEKKQTQAVKAFRRTRNSSAANKGLENLRQAAQGKDNLVEPVLRAVQAKATLGEIADSLREVFGEYKP